MKCAWPKCEKDWIKDKLGDKHPIMAKFCEGHPRFCRDHDETYQMLSPGAKEAVWKWVLDNYENSNLRKTRGHT